jgi:uncharacterized UPF0160 family protein
MTLSIATHNGPFHADDVMAVGLLRTFVDREATVDRSRDPERWARADVVVDVGGVFDPDARRFDHHQKSYEGPRSSAGMVLDWLIDTGRIDPLFGQSLRHGVMDHLDAVDNGRVAPDPTVPCFPRIVAALNEVADSAADFDDAFETAVDVASAFLAGLTRGHEKIREAEAAVVAAMEEAREAGRNVIFLDRYVNWKPSYFAHGGAEHPTEFVLFPGIDGSWRIVAIPPALGDFAQKRSFPEAWAGLTDDALTAVTGVPGSVFCHRNRFIAVFQTREGALDALRSIGFLERSTLR